MTDRRVTLATDHVAHASLRGQIDVPRFADGEPLQITAPLTDLLATTGGARDRQLWLGDSFLVIDRQWGFAFGRAGRDGSCGWVAEAALGPVTPLTHWVASPGTHLYDGPRVQRRDLAALPMGARVSVTGETGAFAETPMGFVPRAHLRALGDWHSDPATVAEAFLHTPYLWGGNSRAGLDCSGLVQGALLACGRACPADSDQQQALGAPLDDDTPLRRGDLLFWRGHVAMVTDPATLIHATGHSMDVCLEPIAPCITRIAHQGGGPVLCRKRP